MKKKNIVGNNIRKYRLQAKITQEELALKSGLSQGYINQLENGKRNYTQKSLERIAETLSISITEFFQDSASNQAINIAEKNSGYQKAHYEKRDFLMLLDSLPASVVEHYYRLLKLEVELLKKSQDNFT